MNYFQNQPMMMQNQQQLPVPADRIINPTIMGGLPDMPFTFPTVQLAPHMQNYNRSICGYAMYELTQNREKNPLRVFCYNFMSMNDWNNDPFRQLVSVIADYAEFLMATQNMQILQAIAQSAMAVCTWMSATLTGMFPALLNYVAHDQGMVGEIQNLLNAYNVTMQNVRNFKSRMGGYQQPSYGGMQQAQPMQNMGVSYAPPAAVGAVMPVGAGMFTGGAAPSPANNNIPMPGMGASVGLYKEPKQETIVEEVTFTPRQTPDVVYTAPAKTKRNYKGMPLASDVPDIARTWTKERPYSFAYNPKTHVMFYSIQNNAPIEEIIKPIHEVGMDYAAHELDVSFALKAFNETLPLRKNTQAEWEKLNEMKKVVDIVNEVDRDARLPIDRTVFCNDRFFAENMQKAVASAKVRLDAKQIKPASNAPIVFTYRDATPFYLEESELELINELRSSFKEAREYVDVLSILENTAGKIREDIWCYINKRLTTCINRELTIGMGMKTTIDDFYTDFLALMRILENKGVGIKNTFLSNQKEKVKILFRSLKGEHLKEYVSSIGGVIPEEIKNVTIEHSVSPELDKVVQEFESRYMVFYEDHMVVLVPWMSKNIDLVMRENAGAVMESLFPDLFLSLTGLIEFSSNLNIRRRHIVTADSVVIDFDNGTFSKDVIIVSKSGV